MLQKTTLPRGMMTEPTSQWMTPAEVQRAVDARWTKPRRLRIVERLAREGVTVEVVGGPPRVYLIHREQFLAYLDDLRQGRRPPPDWWLELHPMT